MLIHVEALTIWPAATQRVSHTSQVLARPFSGKTSYTAHPRPPSLIVEIDSGTHLVRPQALTLEIGSDKNFRQNTHEDRDYTNQKKHC